MNPRVHRLAIVLALAALTGMLAWTVVTGEAPNPYGIELTLPEDSSQENHMIAKPAPGQDRNLEVERSLESLDTDAIAKAAHHGSIRYKSSYGFEDIGYTRLTNLNGKTDSDLVTCKVHEAAPWTIWGMMYNRETNVGRYATDTGGAPRLCPIILSDRNHEYHMTGSEHWPVNQHSIRWSVKSVHDASAARAAALDAHEIERERLVPRDPDYEGR